MTLTEILTKWNAIERAATQGPLRPRLGSGVNMMTALASDTPRDGRKFVCDFQPPHFDSEGYTPPESDYRPDMAKIEFLWNNSAALLKVVEEAANCRDHDFLALGCACDPPNGHDDCDPCALRRALAALEFEEDTNGQDHEG